MCRTLELGHDLYLRHMEHSCRHFLRLQARNTILAVVSLSRLGVWNDFGYSWPRLDLLRSVHITFTLRK
jgi:hypothetical protein